MNGIDKSLQGITHKKINRKILANYLEFAYFDLITRIGREEGVTHDAFYLFMQFPPFLAKRLFECFDKKKKHILNKEEFIENLILLYSGDIKSKLDLYFNLMDMNSDGNVLLEDIKIIFIQLHIFKFVDDFSLLEKILSQSNIPDSFNIEQWHSMLQETQNQHLLVILFDFFFENTKPFSRTALSRFETEDDLLFDLELEDESPELSNDLLDYFKYILRPNNAKPTIVFLNQKKLSMCLGEGARKEDDEFYTPSQPEKYLRTNLHCSSKSTKASPIEDNAHPISMIKQSFLGEVSTKDDELNREDNEHQLLFSNSIYPVVLIEQNDQRFHYNLELIDSLFLLYEINSTDVIKRLIDFRYCYLEEEEPLQIRVNVSFNIGQSLKLSFENKDDYSQMVKKLKSSGFFRKVMADYDIKELLGKGNFGEVNRAVHRQTREEFAIKAINKSNFGPRELEYVYQEVFTIKYLMKINHKNIIKAYDIYENQEKIYCVFEYLSLGDMDQYLNTQATVSMRDIKHICFELAQTIAFLHKIGMIHRDLKLQNILFKVDPNTNELMIKLIDFGFCTVIGRNQKKNDGIGTLNYMSPEIINRDDYSYKVDVWSFGVIMYYLRYRRLPFDDSKGRAKINEKIRLGSFKCGLRSPEVSEEDDKGFKQIIAQCFQVAPDKRISSERLLNDPWFSSIPNSIGID